MKITLPASTCTLPLASVGGGRNRKSTMRAAHCRGTGGSAGGVSKAEQGSLEPGGRVVLTLKAPSKAQPRLMSLTWRAALDG